MQPRYEAAQHDEQRLRQEQAELRGSLSTVRLQPGILQLNDLNGILRPLLVLQPSVDPCKARWPILDWDDAAPGTRLDCNDADVAEQRPTAQHGPRVRAALLAITQVRESVARAERELANPNYDKINARFRKQLIKLETTKMATSDLETCHKVCS